MSSRRIAIHDSLALDASRRYSSNALNQYTAVATTGYIPLRGRADADARVAVTVTVDGHSETFTPARDGQEFSVDIPVDNSSGDVTATVRVDALKPGGGQDPDLLRSLSGEYAVSAAVPETPAYDADGNMLSNDGWTYTWNAQDRLASAAKGTVRLEFAYDYMGRRFEKKVYEGNTLARHRLYAYDGFKQIAEYDALSNNALASTYVWQPAGLDVPLLRNGSEFCVSDANKNIVALIDANGTVTDTYIYDPFGNCTHSGTSSNPFRFSSEVHDVETGLVYYNYRYYSPRLGRWIRRDLIGERGGVNLLVFVLNNSIGYYDQYGQLVCLNLKLLSRYLCRFCKLENRMGIYDFYDENNELSKDENVKKVFNNIICGKIRRDNISSKWQKVLVQKCTINELNCGVYFLNGVNGGFDLWGSFDVRCDNGEIRIKNIYLVYTWNDEIDANSVKDTLAYYQYDYFNGSKLYDIEGYEADWAHQLENVWDATVETKWKPNYKVRIHGVYEENEDLSLNCE